MVDLYLGLVDFASHLGKFLGATTKYDRGVGFGNRERTDDP